MKQKILVIDDEPDILFLMDNFLTRKGFKVRTASGGAKAIELFKAESADLLIVDIKMPGTDGLEVMKQIRQLDEDAEFIILSGFPSIEVAVHALKDYRAYDYLTKPLRNLDSLYITIDQALERRRLRHEKKELISKLKQEIEERKRIEESLQNSKRELEIKTENLEETNIALAVLLKKRDEDKKDIENKVLYSIRKLVIPYLEKLKHCGLTDDQKNLLSIIEINLNDVVSPFVHELSSVLLNLTPQEIQVADLVRQGKTTKEIAKLLNLSPRTIESHRNSIRKKMGIKKEKTNLRTYLLSIQ